MELKAVNTDNQGWHCTLGIVEAAGSRHKQTKEHGKNKNQQSVDA
jgi:hypothetical protein